MAFGDYSTLANVKQDLKVPDNNDDQRLTRLITAASRAIDNWCLVEPKHFVGQAKVRFYDIGADYAGPVRWPQSEWYGGSQYDITGDLSDPTGSLLGPSSLNTPTIFIDPMLAVPDEVAVDSNLDGTYASKMVYLTDYDLWPVNALVDGQRFLAIRALPATATVSFPVGRRTLRVKSLFGWQAPDATIQTLALTGAPTGGTFALAYGGVQSAPIAYNATGDDVETALLAMPSLARLTGGYQGSSSISVSDGNLPVDTLTVTLPATPVGLTVAATNLTGGTAPAVALSAAAYTGPSYPPDLEQACILTVAKWAIESRSAPIGVYGTAETGMIKVGPQSTVQEILVDGGYLDPWLVV